MPYLPKKMCRYPGCSRIVLENGYCEAYKNKAPGYKHDPKMHSIIYVVSCSFFRGHLPIIVSL